jgi:putative oxidoreductase
LLQENQFGFIRKTHMMKEKLAGYYRLYRNSASSLQSLFLLFVRVYWGWQFIQTGLVKLNHIPRVTEYFAQLGMPIPHETAIFVSLLEVVGGCLLILGLASRLIAFPLFIDMLVAFIAADREAFMSFVSDPGKFYGAAPYTFLFASLMILIFGPGLFAVDTLIAKKWTMHAHESSE